MKLRLTDIRLQNTLWLFEAFRQQVAPGDVAVRGLDKAFAGQLGVSPSYWAQVKSADNPKNIGPNWRANSNASSTCRRAGSTKRMPMYRRYPKNCG